MEAMERECAERERERIEGEKRWEAVLDEWLGEARLEGEAGWVGEEVE